MSVMGPRCAVYLSFSGAPQLFNTAHHAHYHQASIMHWHQQLIASALVCCIVQLLRRLSVVLHAWFFMHGILFYR